MLYDRKVWSDGNRSRFVTVNDEVVGGPEGTSHFAHRMTVDDLKGFGFIVLRTDFCPVVNYEIQGLYY